MRRVLLVAHLHCLPLCGVLGLGFGIWDFGFGFWVLGFGFWVLGFGFWVFGFWVLGFGCLGSGFWVQALNLAFRLVKFPESIVQVRYN